MLLNLFGIININWIFLFFCFILGWCGAETPDNIAIPFGVDAAGQVRGLNFTWLSRIATIYYFAYFVLILPILGLVETPKDRPDSITKAVLGDTKHTAILPAE